LSTRIGPYRVLRLIRIGGQGGVYLGYDSRLQRRVAIKVHRLPDERAGRKRLLREAQLVASIQSPKVVQIYDLVVAHDNVALIMEYVPGCDLEDFLGQAKPSLASVLTVATDLAGALAAARQQDIVHGDLKARNVLVTDSGRVKLTDFGIARSGSQLTPGVLEAGSPGCISPEQYLGKSLDVRSDLFALGCLLYRMLTGVQPFIRDGQLDPRRLLEEMPRAVEELVVDLPTGLPELVNGLLQKNPADRPHDTQQVRYALRNIARTVPLSVSSTLLEEARSIFREESPGDIPPLIPPDLRRGGRSRLRPFRLNEIWSWRSLSPGAAALSLGGALLLGALALWLMRAHFVPGETRIHIDEPIVRVASGIELPSELSPDWLVEQVVAAASSRLGPIVVTGPVGASEVRTLYASPPESRAEEKLSISLRCRGDMCLISLVRERGGKQESQQAILFSDMPLPEWSRVIRNATLALYD
jgi:serine/threonine protein kinase